MKRNRVLISGAVLVAAWMGAGGTGAAQSQGKSGQTIHPDPSTSVGGSQSERQRESGVPFPQGSPQSGTVEKGTSGSAPSGTAQSQGKSGETIHPAPKTSVGGSQSERARESGVPLPQGSPHSGTVDTNRGSMMGQRNSMTNSKAAQQALKDKGYDPGPIDGRMGARTTEAIKSFQSASNLEATGTLDAKTAEQLGVQSGSRATRSRDSMKSDGNTTRGKDTDQPNLPPSGNK